MKIKPRYKDGEPMCNGDYCPSYKRNVIACRYVIYTCESYDDRKEVLPGGLCIPMLRKQRDDYKRERDDARRQNEN